MISIHMITLTLELRLRAIFPRQMVVLVLIPGCSSFAVLAKCLRSSPLRVRSDNFGATDKMDLTVCSRTTGVMSVKPVTYSAISKAFT